ncbi:hypothetical protein [Parasphaerochaeta coccoides]|nr:hypothetical protein [Parasphaerochaeta coccoides]
MRTALLVVQIIIAVVLLSVIGYTVSRLYADDSLLLLSPVMQENSRLSLLLNVFMPSVLHIVASVIAAGLLRYHYRSQTGIEAQILPVLLLASTIGYVVLLPWFSFVSKQVALSAPVISAIYHFSQIFIALGYAGCALMHNSALELNLNRYMFSIFVFSVFGVSIAPITSNSLVEPVISHMPNNMFSIAVLAIEIIAIVAFTIGLIKESNKHERMRYLAFILMTVGSSFLCNYFSVAFNIAGIIFFVTGAFFLVFLTRTYQVWT